MKIYFDPKIVSSLLHIELSDLAIELGYSVEYLNNISEGYDPDISFIEKLYSYSFSKGLRLNKIFEGMDIDSFNKEKSKALFHGTGKEISFPLDLLYSRNNLDFGKGFYLGERFNQAAAYICNCKTPFVYTFNLDIRGLKIYRYEVNLEWMLSISYHRGYLDKYANRPLIKEIVDKIKDADLIIAPIADNRMFDIISQFINGEITDLACQHALAVTDLGKQYVIRSEKGINALKLIRMGYLSENEKKEYKIERVTLHNNDLNKVGLARINYKNKGKYIDEVFIDEES